MRSSVYPPSLEEFRCDLTIFHLPKGQCVNIKNTSDLDKLRNDETNRFLAAGANLYVGTLDVSQKGKFKQESLKLRGVHGISWREQ